MLKTGAIKNIFYNFLASGKTPDTENVVRYPIFNCALVLGAINLVVFGITVMLNENMIRGILDLFMAAICIITILVLRTKIPLALPGIITAGAFGALCIVFVYSADLGGLAALWIYSYPLIALLCLGFRAGSVLTGLLFIGTLVTSLSPQLAGTRYTMSMVSRMAGPYFLITCLTIAYELIRRSREKHIRELADSLRVEHGQMIVMKDSLRAGLFLMDKDYIIQPAYSKALEDILGTEEIEGKKFTDFLAASIKVKEKDSLNIYFDMLINQSHDKKLLKEINPISEFVYINEETQEEKILRTTFSPVEWAQGEYYIMGALSDLSNEKHLERQLLAEKSRREAEIRAFFQVVQIDPRVFNDFIEDTEYEFERINDVLKDRSVSAADAMAVIYQSIHAIKSNALILGLDAFGGKLHELETKIRQIQGLADIKFDNVLHITIKLEKIMKEKDKFGRIADKLETFKIGTGDRRRQDRYVLIETLTRACERTADNLGKKAKFVVDEFDGLALEKGPRRVMKEVLTQLVRNSVFHGIETPEDRCAKGKSTEGLIRLSVKLQNDKIHINLSDDGQGLDLENIRKKARSLNLLQGNNGDDTDELLQVIFIPGFSTVEAADINAGRGIGLNLVMERIKGLHGSIKLQTKQGKGTEVDILIPIETESLTNKAS